MLRKQMTKVLPKNGSRHHWFGVVVVCGMFFWFGVFSWQSGWKGQAIVVWLVPAVTLLSLPLVILGQWVERKEKDG